MSLVCHATSDRSQCRGHCSATERLPSPSHRSWGAGQTRSSTMTSLRGERLLFEGVARKKRGDVVCVRRKDVDSSGGSCTGSWG